MLEKLYAEKSHDEAKHMVAIEDAALIRRKVDLDAHEEDLAGCEATLTANLHNKDEELESLVAWKTKELDQKHKEELAT